MDAAVELMGSGAFAFLNEHYADLFARVNEQYRVTRRTLRRRPKRTSEPGSFKWVWEEVPDDGTTLPDKHLEPRHMSVLDKPSGGAPSQGVRRSGRPMQATPERNSRCDAMYSMFYGNSARFGPMFYLWSATKLDGVWHRQIR